jgi:hyperosmotically inducible periplasmic protein
VLKRVSSGRVIAMAGLVGLCGVIPLLSAQKRLGGMSAAQSRIVEEIRHNLVMLPNCNVFDNLEFKYEAGTVTLRGQVTRPTLKSDAETTVRRLEGINKVVNDIEVLPVSPMDDQIRLAEYRAIFSRDPLAIRYGVRAVPPIHIVVKNGNVTLEGIVANQTDKDLAGIAANGVPNVFSVKNNLTIEQK